MRHVIKCDDKLFECFCFCIFAAWSGHYDKYNPSEEALRMIEAFAGSPAYLVW